MGEARPKLDRNAPTRWRYPDGKPVPLWHALDTLACHWRFGYRWMMAGRSRKESATNPNPDFRAAQAAGWDAALADERGLEERGAEYARRLVDGLVQATAEST